MNKSIAVITGVTDRIGWKQQKGLRVFVIGTAGRNTDKTKMVEENLKKAIEKM